MILKDLHNEQSHVWIDENLLVTPDSDGGCLFMQSWVQLKPPKYHGQRLVAGIGSHSI
jgi:hypothetical protein